MNHGRTGTKHYRGHFWIWACNIDNAAHILETDWGMYQYKRSRSDTGQTWCNAAGIEKEKYVAGHEDTGGELQTVFNDTDTFDEQWNEMLDEYKDRTAGQSMWFCAYHPSKATMNVYIVEPGSLPSPEYAVGNVLQYTITNTLVDLPDPIPAVKPTAPTTT